MILSQPVSRLCFNAVARGFSSTITPSPTASRVLTWPEYFTLRRRIQLLQRAAGIPFAFGFLTAEGAILSLPIFDPTKMMFGMDPLVMVGLSTIVGTAVSYFAGVSLSGLFWRKLKPQLAQQLNEVHT